LAFSILAAAVQASLDEYQAQLAAQVTALTQALAQRGIYIASSSDITTIETQVFSGASAVFETLATSLSSAFLVILILFFLLMDAPNILGRVANSPGAQTALFENAVGYFGEVRNSLYRVTAINLAQGIYIAVVLLAFGVDFAFLWGLLAFILLYVPVAGLLIAVTPAIFIALVTKGPLIAILVALAILGVPFLFQRYTRRYLPPRENISFVVVFFALALSFWIFGLAGLLLAVPLVVMAQIIFDSFPETRWAAILIRGKQEAPPSQAEPATDTSAAV
jgi:AI-2 transport protein TqsA